MDGRAVGLGQWASLAATAKDAREAFPERQDGGADHFSHDPARFVPIEGTARGLGSAVIEGML